MSDKAQIALMLALQATPVPTAADRTALAIPDEISLSQVRFAQAAMTARDLLTETDPESKGGKSVAVVDQVDGEHVKRIVSTVENVQFEERSQRVLVTFRGKPYFDKRKQVMTDGRETARTDRLDDWTPTGRLIARRVRELIGRRVSVWIEYEQMRSGDPVRIIKHVRDLGPASERDFEPRAEAA